jgi:alpha-galactosidase
MGFKVVFIGAGSIGFTRELVRDLLCVPEFAGGGIELVLMDIDAGNLDKVNQLCERDIRANGLPTKLTATTERRDALRDAKYVFNVARVGGLDAFQLDIDIPLKYGVDQCVGDTLGPGGIMYGQRGIPVILDFCKDIRAVSRPDCLFLNYANPNAMLTWAANTYGGVRTIGLCHGVQAGHFLIADALGVKKDDLDIVCAGINHQAWYVQIRYRGKDMTDRLLNALEKHPVYSKTEKVRIDMLKSFGYFSTESNGHLSEYVAWYRKRPKEIKKWIDTGHGIGGETGGYLRICREGRNLFETDFRRMMKKEPLKYLPARRSVEHGSRIIEGLETGRIYRGHFNVVNNGCISNLPDDAVVEVPGYADANGVGIPHVGPLPLGCAAVCNASITVQRLAVEAAVRGDETLLRQAMMMDPLTGAVCDPPEIRQMADEMLIAQEKWLPQYAKAVRDAKERRRTGRQIPTKKYRGAVRLKVRTAAEIRKEMEVEKKKTAKRSER